MGKAEAIIRYANLSPGTYYFEVCNKTYPSGTQYYNLTITPDLPAAPPTQPAFVAGSVAKNITAVRSGNAINVNWGAVTSARYAVYYNARSNATGAYNGWGVATVGGTTLAIANPAPNVTYYITILPFSDNPRVYGGFSAYTLIRT